jgi:hypothetical protein
MLVIHMILFILWRARGTGDAVRFVNSLYYDFTSRHYNFFYNVRSSLLCWFFILVGPLISGFLVAALICSYALLPTLRLWSVPLLSSRRCVSDRFLCSPPDVVSLIGSFDLVLTLRLWSVPLFCSWRCVSDRFLWSPPDVASLVGSFELSDFYSLPPWNRVLAPRIKDTLSKGYFSSVGQVVV